MKFTRLLAMASLSWLDGSKMGIEGGGYGGQLTNWIMTRTDRFKAAIPTAGISNPVTENYVSYYHDYLAVEYGDFPHENGNHRQTLGPFAGPVCRPRKDAGAVHPWRKRQ